MHVHVSVKRGWMWCDVLLGRVVFDSTVLENLQSRWTGMRQPTLESRLIRIKRDYERVATAPPYPVSGAIPSVRDNRT